MLSDTSELNEPGLDQVQFKQFQRISYVNFVHYHNYRLYPTGKFKFKDVVISHFQSFKDVNYSCNRTTQSQYRMKKNKKLASLCRTAWYIGCNLHIRFLIQEADRILWLSLLNCYHPRASICLLPYYRVICLFNSNSLPHLTSLLVLFVILWDYLDY